MVFKSDLTQAKYSVKRKQAEASAKLEQIVTAAADKRFGKGLHAKLNGLVNDACAGPEGCPFLFFIGIPPAILLSMLDTTISESCLQRNLHL